MIHTKFHVLQEIIRDRDKDNITLIDYGGSNITEAVKTVELMSAAPTYCMDPQVVGLLVREDVERSILAIMKAGIAKLPFDPMMVEFTPPTEGLSSRYFIWLSEMGNQMIRTLAACLSKTDQELLVMSDPLDIEIVEDGLICSSFMKDDPMAWAAMAAVSLSLLMLNTKGIEKQVIYTGKLNKARRKAGDGRLPIPQHTVVRIGTIYDRSGRGHSVTATGRHMPVHLRAGHTRHQHFGKGNEEVKIIFIPPCIVNFRDESGEKPALPHKTITI